MGESSKTPGEADRDNGNGGGGGGGRGGGGSAGGVRDLVNKKNATRIDRIANAVDSDKTKGKKALSVLGNSAAILGNEMAAGMANMADIGDALQTFALTGDANGIQGAMATAGGGSVFIVGGAGSVVGGAIKQGVQSYRDIKARQGSTTEQNKVRPTDKSLGKLKQQTGQNEGQSDTGAHLMASMKEKPVEQDLYEAPETDTTSYSNDSDSQDASNAISAFKQSNNGTVKSAIMKDNNGKNIKGNLYQFKNSNGENTSFFVSDSVAKSAKNIDPKEQSVSGGEPRKVGQQVSAVSSSNVQSELVRSKGNVANVVDANGNNDDKHEYRNYAGRIYQIPKKENSKAKEKVQKLLNHAQNGTGNVNMTQTEKSFAYAMSQDNGQPIACNNNGSFDLSVNDSSDTGAYTNAAMVTALGTEVQGKENTYSLGGKEFYTGMSKSDATAIAKGVGITKMSNQDGIISYRQGAPAIGSTPTEVRHLNGKTIAQYDIGIGSGKGYAPTDFVATDRGGGTLTFPSPKAAEMFMRTNGNIAMAEAIHGVERGKDLDFGLGFINLSNDGKLNIKYSETSLAACGIKIERAAGDRQKLMVSSSNGEVVNPFFASGEITEKTNNGGYIPEPK